VVIASYASVGLGVLWMLVLLFVAVGCWVWIAYWIPRGFRAKSDNPPVALRWWLLRIVVLAATMACFPPQRRIGVWREVQTGRLLPPGLANSYDRSYFGYIPSYHWIGHVRRTETPEFSAIVGIADHGRYQLTKIEWAIDWLCFNAQLGVALLFMLPFMLSRPGANAAR
jgi:hypothetical protein